MVYEKKTLEVETISENVKVPDVKAEKAPTKKVEKISAEDEIQLLNGLVEYPDPIKVEEEDKEIIEAKRKNLEESLQYQYAEAYRIYKLHLIGRVRDCVKEKDKIAMAKQTDEFKWQKYLSLNCPPPDVGGNKKLYDLRVEYDRILLEDRELIRNLEHQAMGEKITLKK